VYSDKDIKIQPHLALRCGIDFGWSDPNTFVITQYDKKTNTIYIIDEIEQSNLELDKFATKIKAKLVKHGLNPLQLISCDSADPLSIKILQKEGLNARKAVTKAKWAGIMWLKQQKFVISNNCKKFHNSVQAYHWKKDRTGETTDDTDHEGSDLLDGFRYGYGSEIKSSTGIKASYSNLI
jgi:phage terminase large subunit